MALGLCAVDSVSVQATAVEARKDGRPGVSLLSIVYFVFTFWKCLKLFSFLCLGVGKDI